MDCTLYLHARVCVHSHLKVQKVHFSQSHIFIPSFNLGELHSHQLKLKYIQIMHSKYSKHHYALSIYSNNIAVVGIMIVL